MSTCPWCGERVPFGGGRTAKNAHKLFQEADAVANARDVLKEASASMDPPQDVGADGVAARVTVAGDCRPDRGIQRVL